MNPLVYVAGPYTNPDPVWNTHNTVREAEKIEALGCDVVIPHLSLLWHAISPAPLARWYERDLAVMHRCDAVVRLPGASTGADAEVEAFAGTVFFWPDDEAEMRFWIKNYAKALRGDFVRRNGTHSVMYVPDDEGSGGVW